MPTVYGLASVVVQDEDELPPEGRSLSSEEFEQIWKPQRYWYNLKEMDQNQVFFKIRFQS